MSTFTDENAVVVFCEKSQLKMHIPTEKKVSWAIL